MYRNDLPGSGRSRRSISARDIGQPTDNMTTLVYKAELRVWYPNGWTQSSKYHPGSMKINIHNNRWRLYLRMFTVHDLILITRNYINDETCKTFVKALVI